jgi:hypothetical protein
VWRVEQVVKVKTSGMGRQFGCILGVLLAAVPGEALAGAWTLDAGTWQVMSIGQYSSGGRIFDADRNVQSAPRYSKFELTTTIEYGATNWLTMILVPQLQRIDVGSPVDAHRAGFGYTELGGRVQLYDGGTSAFSVQATARIHGTTDYINPAAIGYTDNQFEVRALWGQTFELASWPAFVGMEVAQRFRTGGAPDEFRADFTFGVRAIPRWLFLAQSFNVVSEGAGSWGYPSYDYFKVQLSAVYELTPAIWLQAGGFTAFAGRNALQENGAIFGAWFRF